MNLEPEMTTQDEAKLGTGQNHLITAEEISHTAKSIHYILRRGEELIVRIIKGNLTTKDGFIKNLNVNEDNRKAIESDILRIHGGVLSKDENGKTIPAFSSKIIPNITFKNQERNSFDHEVHNATPEIMWDHVGSLSGELEFVTKQGELVSINIDAALLKPTTPTFCDIKYIISHILFYLNNPKPRDESQRRDLTEKLKAEIAKLEQNSKVKLPEEEQEIAIKSQKLKEFLTGSGEKESEIKTKILGISVMKPTQSEILLTLKKHNYQEKLVTHLTENLVLHQKIKNIGEIYIPVDLKLCQEAFGEIQDDIIELIGGKQ